MALPIASRPVGGLQNCIPKLTAVEKIGGILCHICNYIFGNKKDYDRHYALHNIEGAEVVYTCVACKKQISGYPSFRGHCYLNHVVKNKFQCNQCDKSFAKLSILNSHISAVHDYKCNSCEDRFSSKKDLETHKAIHGTVKKDIKDEPPYNCVFCNKLIITIVEYESHIDDHCEVHYPCPICKEVLPNKLEATKHLTKHFDQNISSNILAEVQTTSKNSSIDVLGGILCCHCHSLFPNRSEIDAHFSMEHEDKAIVYTCNICEKQYEKYAMFGDHCHFHISRDRFQCDECEKNFPRLSLLVLHTEAFHTGSAPRKPYSCGPCGHRFDTRPRLREHMRLVHEEEAPIQCTQPGCFATFSRPRELVAHSKRHAEAAGGDAWCRQCGLHFGSAESAARHLAVHSRRQYRCGVCARAFHLRHLALKHAAPHFAREKHACALCGRAYGRRSRLAAHLRSHAASATRRHQCQLCDKGFLKPHELRQHLNVHAGRRPFLCHLCPRAFTNRPNWAKHLMRVHGLDAPAVRRLAVSDPALTDPILAPPDHSLAPPDPTPASAVPDLTPAPALPDPVPRMFEAANEKSDFKPIVDHIDAKTDVKPIVDPIDAKTEGLNPPEPPSLTVDAEDELRFAEMTPVTDVTFLTDTVQNILEDGSYATSIWFPESGPDFKGLGMRVLGEEFNLEDHLMPHIDPRLTIRTDDDVKLYLDNIDNLKIDHVTPLPPHTSPYPSPAPDDGKVFKFEDQDANRLYIFY